MPSCIVLAGEQREKQIATANALLCGCNLDVLEMRFGGRDFAERTHLGTLQTNLVSMY